ncbi:Antitoxin CptB [Roseovarius sp. THAF27]|uniref:FAD assembly factor SdhE n=1 Tax=unclassified Roseovarius TaxID=2614913 RepID=UPI00126953A5|nr:MULTISPECIES: succinate dehydrogenase assembly factor 2 [unclassified Roseovarius]QFT81533.1 Antitoxin CptB [Roseovarius sp. THAF27]QFT99333.1 Antitoxin CptB [Roseovarius sp. THAF8]
MTETGDTRLKRLRMRSMRRGTKEMDILLMRFSEARLAALSPAELDLYETLLEENDQDLYQWVTGQTPPPPHLADLIGQVRAVSAG